MLNLISKYKIMKQKIFLNKNNDLLNVMFRGTPCIWLLPLCMESHLKLR